MKYLLVLLFLLIPNYSLAAISYNNASGSTNNNCTLSHTTNSGSDRMLVVFAIGDTTDTLTSITYNGTNLTYVAKIQYPTDRWNYLYILPAPTVGTYNVIQNGSTWCSLLAISYNGVDQSSTPDSSNTRNGTGSPWDISTTVNTSDSWLVGGVYGTYPISTTITPGSVRGSSAAVGSIYGDSNGTVGTGSQTLSFNNNDAARTAVGLILSLAPAGTGGGGTSEWCGVDVLSTTTVSCTILGLDACGNVVCMATATTTAQFIISQMAFQALFLFLIALILGIWTWRSFMP